MVVPARITVYCYVHVTCFGELNDDDDDDEIHNESNYV